MWRETPTVSHSFPPDQRDGSVRGIHSHINTSPLLWNLAVVVHTEALAEDREDEELCWPLLPGSGFLNLTF